MDGKKSKMNSLSDLEYRLLDELYFLSSFQKKKGPEMQKVTRSAKNEESQDFERFIATFSAVETRIHRNGRLE